MYSNTRPSEIFDRVGPAAQAAIYDCAKDYAQARERGGSAAAEADRLVRACKTHMATLPILLWAAEHSGTILRHAGASAEDVRAVEQEVGYLTLGSAGEPGRPVASVGEVVLGVVMALLIAVIAVAVLFFAFVLGGALAGWRQDNRRHFEETGRPRWPFSSSARPLSEAVRLANADARFQNPTAPSATTRRVCGPMVTKAAVLARSSARTA